MSRERTGRRKEISSTSMTKMFLNMWFCSGTWVSVSGVQWCLFLSMLRKGETKENE